MTIVVGFCCDEGIVVASDSQISTGATSRSEQKVWIVDVAGFAFGLSGAESTMHLLRDYLLTKTFDTTNAATVRAGVAQIAVDVFQPEYSRLLSLGFTNDAAQAWAIVGIYAGDEPHLFQLHPDGSVIDHYVRRFAACGSGEGFAEHAATVFREAREGMSLHQAKMMAFRVIQDAIAAAGPAVAVGGAIQVATVSKQRSAPPKCDLLPPEDPELKETVQWWVSLEAERFRQHSPPSDPAEDEP